jgi:hypothetical protein
MWGEWIWFNHKIPEFIQTYRFSGFSENCKLYKLHAQGHFPVFGPGLFNFLEIQKFTVSPPKQQHGRFCNKHLYDKIIFVIPKLGLFSHHLFLTSLINTKVILAAFDW